MQETYTAVYGRPWASSGSATAYCRRAEGSSNVQKKDVWIAILGRSGSGKTSVVNQIINKGSEVSKAPVFEVGTAGSMHSCTKHIQISPPIPLDNDRQLRLIDTVAFDNGDRSDYEILAELSDHLTSLYRKKTLLNGVIFLHRISDVRMGGSPKINFDMALKICGEEFYSNVVLMTTKWSKAGPTPVEVKREEDLKTNPRIFHPLLMAGGTYMRYDGTAESVWKAVEILCGLDGKVLHLQKELVDMEYPLDVTAAGTHASFPSRRSSRVPSPEPRLESLVRPQQGEQSASEAASFVTVPSPQPIPSAEHPSLSLHVDAQAASYIPHPFDAATASGSAGLQPGVGEEEILTARPGPHPSFSTMPEPMHFHPPWVEKPQPTLQERYEQTLAELRILEEKMRAVAERDQRRSMPSMPSSGFTPMGEREKAQLSESERSREAIQELLEETRRAHRHVHDGQTSRPASRPTSAMSFSDEVSSRKAPTPPTWCNTAQYAGRFHPWAGDASGSGGWNVAQSVSLSSDGHYVPRMSAPGSSRSSSPCPFFPTRTLNMQVEN